MISFLNNLFLPFLAAAGLPVLIHFLLRKKIQRKEFPTLRFLKEQQKKQMKRLKLRQILLLIIRTLIILFAVAAFARPAIKGVLSTPSVDAHEPTSVVILLDNSYSMNQESKGVEIFTRAKSKTQDILNLLKAGDKCALVTFNEDPQVVVKPTQVFETVQKSLDTLSTSDRSTNIFKALGKATDILEKSKHLNKEIYILTDNKNNGWKKWSEIKKGENTSIYTVPFEGDDDDNRGINSLDFPNQLIEIDKPIKLSAQVKNYSAKPKGGVITSFFVNGNRNDQKGTDLSPRESKIVSGNVSVPSGGIHQGFAKIEGDAILADNKRYFSFKIPEKLNILLVGAQGSRTIFRLALNPGDESKFFDISGTQYSRLGSEQLRNSDIVYLIDPPQFSTKLTSRLLDFVKDGGGVFIILGPNTDIKFLQNNLLNEITSTTISEPLGFSGTQSFLNNGEPNFQHPLFKIFDRKEGIPKVKYYNFYPVSSEAKQIHSYSNGSPALLEYSKGDGRLLLLTTFVVPSWSNLATSGFFVPLLHRGCQYLSSDLAKFSESYKVGEDITRNISEYSSGGKIKLMAPDSSVTFLSPDFYGGGVYVKIPTLKQAGIYKIYVNQELVDAFASNIKPTESKMQQIEKDVVNKKLEVNWVDPQDNIREVILTSRYGHELWKPFLWIVFGLMIAELAIGSTWKEPESVIDEES